jgi:hypothetical protein
MVGHGDTGAIAQLAPILFVGANIAVGLIALATLRLIFSAACCPQPLLRLHHNRSPPNSMPGLIRPHLPSRKARIVSMVLAGCSSISQ